MCLSITSQPYKPGSLIDSSGDDFHYEREKHPPFSSFSPLISSGPNHCDCIIVYWGVSLQNCFSPVITRALVLFGQHLPSWWLQKVKHLIAHRRAFSHYCRHNFSQFDFNSKNSHKIASGYKCCVLWKITNGQNFATITCNRNGSFIIKTDVFD